MIKVIGVLSLLLILISGFSYTQYLNLKAKDIEIATQLDVITNKDQEIKDTKYQIEIERGMNNTIVTDTRTSDTSFNSLVNKINNIDCIPKKEVKSNVDIKEISNPVINYYYDVLHSAYRLQNKN